MPLKTIGASSNMNGAKYRGLCQKGICLKGICLRGNMPNRFYALKGICLDTVKFYAKKGLCLKKLCPKGIMPYDSMPIYRQTHCTYIHAVCFIRNSYKKQNQELV